jgi:hypothetical protein
MASKIISAKPAPSTDKPAWGKTIIKPTAYRPPVAASPAKPT